MRAALLVEPGRLEVADIAEPDAGPDEVRIAVGGVGICGSDLSVFSGRWAVPSYPWVMGHEAFGTIDAVGPGVAPERVGQTVVVEPNAACFACDPCRRGWTSACVARQSVGMNRAGALAERLVVPSRFAWEIAGDPADLVCVEPTTVVTAALRRLGMGLPDEVIVVGVGAQGLLMSLVLVERGVRVKVLDPNADRVASAVALGAEPAASADADARFGLVVDTVGSPASIEAALERADVGATLLLLGLDSRPMGLTAQAIVRKQLVIRGSLTYDHPGDFEASIAAVNAGLAPGRIVTDAYALEDAQLAFDRSASTAGKTWIRVDQTS
jgi:alcohol dehydrogenase/L-iditol 2-dehydrogenase